MHSGIGAPWISFLRPTRQPPRGFPGHNSLSICMNVLQMFGNCSQICNLIMSLTSKHLYLPPDCALSWCPLFDREASCGNCCKYCPQCWSRTNQYGQKERGADCFNNGAGGCAGFECRTRTRNPECKLVGEHCRSTRGALKYLGVCKGKIRITCLTSTLF